MTDYENIIISYVLKDIEENKLSKKCLYIIKKDIENANDLGMECDKKDWERLLNKINEVLGDD